MRGLADNAARRVVTPAPQAADLDDSSAPSTDDQHTLDDHRTHNDTRLQIARDVTTSLLEPIPNATRPPPPYTSTMLEITPHPERQTQS